MCCIFTCCGWMIDLVQRLWTFTMSCCICSAVCCALFTASMSGIALGYNYSLAEYIDLKETNVSVYLKRGIFDDEIGDDMNWRRSGHQPVAGHIGEHNLRTGEPEDESSTIRSGRRLDDSIYESDDRNRFEGSLMKLTAKPIVPSPTPNTETTIDMNEIVSKYPKGSLDQMKALQTLINMKKAVDPRRKQGKQETKTTENVIDDRYFPQIPVNPSGFGPGRKSMPMPPVPGVHYPPGNSARVAVPDEAFNEPARWKYPNLPPEAFTADQGVGEFFERPVYPLPVTPRTGPVRPTRPKPTARVKPTLSSAPTPIIGRQEPNYPKSIDEEMDTFKDKLLYDEQGFKGDDFLKNMPGPRQNEDDYAEAIKGVPLRRKRRSMKSKILERVKDKKAIDKNINEDIKTLEPNFHTASKAETNVLPKEAGKQNSNSSKVEVIIKLSIKNDHKDPTASNFNIISSTIASKLLRTLV